MPEDVNKSAADYYRELTQEDTPTDNGAAPLVRPDNGAADPPGGAAPETPASVPETSAPPADKPLTLEDVPAQYRSLIEAQIAEVELKGKLQQGDYTRKTQELAEQRKQVEALRQAYEAQVQAPPAADNGKPSDPQEQLPPFPLDARFLSDDPDEASVQAQVLPAVAQMVEAFVPQLVSHIEQRVSQQMQAQVGMLEPFVRQYALERYAAAKNVDAGQLIQLAEKYQPGSLEQLDLLVEAIQSKSQPAPPPPPSGGETPPAPKSGPIEAPAIRDKESAGDYYRRTYGNG